MDIEYFVEKVNDLKSLYRCYLKLEEWATSTSDSNDEKAIIAGKQAIGNAIKEILEEDRIFQIIASGDAFPLEDFIWFVKTDTASYIDKIETYINNKI